VPKRRVQVLVLMFGVFVCLLVLFVCLFVCLWMFCIEWCADVCGMPALAALLLLVRALLVNGESVC